MMKSDYLKPVLEAAILAADQPLSIKQMKKLFSDNEKPPATAVLREALNQLIVESDGRGVELKEVSSGYRYCVRQEFATHVSRLWEEKPPKYTRALLETLALIAYRQPVTRGDIEDVRGVSVSSNIIRTLSERNWIKVIGHKEVPGRPGLYATTGEFLDYFNLKTLDELPSLKEITDLDLVNPELDLVDVDLPAAIEDVTAARTAETAEPETDDEMDRLTIDEIDSSDLEASSETVSEAEAGGVKH